MKIAIVGAGAIGGYLGAKLALAGEDVTFVARGANLAAIRADGIRLIAPDGTEEHARGVVAVEKAAQAGPQDVVLLTVKAHQVTAVAPDLVHTPGDDSAIVTMQNGIPWWYFHKHGGPHEGRPVRTADPDGTIARLIDPTRLIGSVVYPAADLIAPGVVQVVEGNRFSLGELDGSTTPRIQAISASLTKASFNPISALTHATLVDICQFGKTRELSAKMMAEAEEIAGKLGVSMRISIERRIAGAEKVGAHKTSMLRDVEQGRPLELEALVGAVVELGNLTETPTPHISAVYACASLLARTLAVEQGRLEISRTPER